MLRSWRRPGRRVTAFGGVALTLLGAGIAVGGVFPGSGQAAGPDRAALSAAAADQFVTGESTGFPRAPGESLTRRSVTTTESGLNYANYSRTYQDLRVFVGGDVVVVTDRTGAVKSSSAGSAPIDVDITPRVPAARAVAVARQRHPGTVAGDPALGVVAGDRSLLVWQVVVEHGGAGRVHAFVDAHTGDYVGSWDEYSTGMGTAGTASGDMLQARFGRDGIDGSGGTPRKVAGPDDVTAFYRCAGTDSAADDEATDDRTMLGRGVFCHTPGGDSGISNETGGLVEGTADIFAALAEGLVDPSRAGDPNCWYPAIPNADVRAAAGPLNHWFHLIAAGSGWAGPTCDGGTVKGIGIGPAGQIFYHALLRKTSGWTYRQVRTATLEAALELHPNGCTEFEAVRAAWDAVRVPSREDPACTASSTPALTSAPAGTRLANPADFDIADRAVVESPITANLPGKAPKTLRVDVDITHSFRGDLQIDLVAPDGTAYRLESSNRLDSADDVKRGFTVDASAEPAAGTWMLRVRDRCAGDTGVLNSWALTF
ncbi:proprotein convertase P-domain-containing protein [Actinoplanes subtropicus]|uniref:proprotein convertase P-domain-containing protein n=1 Tax=Actinoplanes subtropicus TaxID=543632 RepID=UPI000689D206|nr:proprotein convertase P-domain-containing protein [Actinoplanes subtropicus]